MLSTGNKVEEVVQEHQVVLQVQDNICWRWWRWSSFNSCFSVSGGAGSPCGTGGAGGAGTGCSTPGPGTAGTANTGGGGGGGAYSGGAWKYGAGGNGGSGIVVLETKCSYFCSYTLYKYSFYTSCVGDNDKVNVYCFWNIDSFSINDIKSS